MPNANIKVMVVEQDDADPFNRAWLFNVGISEAFKYFSPHAQCYVTHDIDLFATPQVDYTWCDRPTQPCSELTCHNNGVPYLKNAGMSGAGLAVRLAEAERVHQQSRGVGRRGRRLVPQAATFRLALRKKPHPKAPQRAKRKVQVLYDHDHTKRHVDKQGYQTTLKKPSRMAKGSNEWTTDGLNTLTYNVTSRHYNKYKTLWIKVKHPTLSKTKAT